ncbi:hypothetical protein AMK16_27655 [Streptomyces sp. CB00455]|nr:hypothetical protein AMK16_27655 [Streptomyces sp. CB00455]
MLTSPPPPAPTFLRRPLVTSMRCNPDTSWCRQAHGVQTAVRPQLGDEPPAGSRGAERLRYCVLVV